MKNSIINNFDQRLQNMVKALFNVWQDKSEKAIPAEAFYHKMAAFGLAPDVKLLENVTNIVYQNR